MFFTSIIETAKKPPVSRFVVLSFVLGDESLLGLPGSMDRYTTVVFVIFFFGSSKKATNSEKTSTSWWLNQPIWKICSSKWESSPIFGVKIKKIICQTLVDSCHFQLLNLLICFLSYSAYSSLSENHLVPHFQGNTITTYPLKSLPSSALGIFSPSCCETYPINMVTGCSSPKQLLICRSYWKTTLTLPAEFFPMSTTEDGDGWGKSWEPCGVWSLQIAISIYGSGWTWSLFSCSFLNFEANLT